MFENEKHLFLCRPTRFGKNLSPSAIECLFKGYRKLFEDMWIHDKCNWEQYPTAHAGFTSGKFEKL